ncbi:MAG: DUF1684 domain-containing protein [Gammaproteobacteria bacterium]|nr:DUF1684 domain-containing protein [Gammaproteobacteria bacterium]
MQKSTTKTWYMPVLALLVASCGDSGAAFDEAAYRAEIMQWRAERLENLLAPTGYLNQIGLYWLEPGSYSFGSAEGNDIVFPGVGDAHIGTFVVDSAGVSMSVRDGVQVRHDEQPVSEILIAADTSDAPVMISHGSLAWTVVERDERYAVRLRNFEHPFVASFGPLPYFAIDPAFRVEAVLRRYDEPQIANVGTVIEGLGYHPESPGVVEFEIGGERFELEAYASGDRLFYVFGDLTSRGVTYGAGRFLYSEMPAEDGKTVLDFNKSYSPPCAFNDFSTCPVASPRNRLPIRIEAGEKYNQSLHYASGK